jgi:2-polyprenyl-6-methoxyphenol hydroxylase-like FAD-dependent oxidoreductase
MNGTQPKETADVLVVGGGPVGLITTYSLLKEGIKVINIGMNLLSPNKIAIELTI